MVSRPDLSKTAHIWVVGGVSLLVGNVAYVLHRTIVHQAVDWLVSWRSPSAYVELVATMIERHFANKPEVKDLMHLKNSQIILTAIFGELCVIVSIWKEPSSRAETHHLCLLWIGILVFAGSVFAHAISHYAAQRLPCEKKS